MNQSMAIFTRLRLIVMQAVLISVAVTKLGGREHIIFKDIGMVLSPERDAPLFREVQSIGGVFELLRPDSTPSEVVSYQVDWFKGLSDTPHKRCLDRIVEFLEEQDGYMSIVEEQLLSFYKDSNVVTHDNRGVETRNGNVKRSVNGDYSETNQKIGQLQAMRVDEHMDRIIHRISAEIRSIEETEDCIAEFLIHFESEKRFEVWQYIRKVDEVKTNLKTIVFGDEAFLQNRIVSNEMAALNQNFREVLLRESTLKVLSVVISRKSLVVEFLINVPSIEEVLPVYKVLQTGFHYEGMSECGIYTNMPEYVIVINSTIHRYDGCANGLCDIEINSPTCCFNGTVSNCGVRKVKCSPARVFSDGTGILIATINNISKTMESGKIVKINHAPSYYIRWDGVSHVSLENVHFPQTGVFFNPRKSPNVSHIVRKASADLSEFDNFTLFNTRMETKFNTSEEEGMINYHISKERVAIKNILKNSDAAVFRMKLGLSVVGGCSLLVMLAVILGCCYLTKKYAGYKLQEGSSGLSEEAVLEMAHKAAHEVLKSQNRSSDIKNCTFDAENKLYPDIDQMT